MALTPEQEAKLIAMIPAFENGETITDMIAATTCDETELIEVSQGGITKKMALSLPLGTKALKARNISAGTGMTGGGTLEDDRTLNVVSADDGITVNADNIQLAPVTNLESTSTTKALSASQGKVLDDKKENVANKSTSIINDSGSDIKYPTVKAVEDYKALSIYNGLDKTDAGFALDARIGADLNQKLENKLDKNLYDAQVIEAGNSNAEIVDARGPFPKLNDRLDGVDSKINKKANSNLYEKAISTPLHPSQLTFKLAAIKRAFSIIDKKFKACDDNFEINSLNRYIPVAYNGGVESTVTKSIANKELTLTSTAATGDFLLMQTYDTINVPFSVSKVRVERQSPGMAVVGFCKPTSHDHMVAIYNSGNNTISAEVLNNGAFHALLSGIAFTPVGAFDLYAIISHNNFIVGVDTGNGFTILGSAYFRAYIDMSEKTNLETWHYAFGFGMSQGNSATFSNFEAGVFGETGIRDESIIKHKDGTPYIKDNKLYINATAGGLSADQSFTTNVFSVYTLDLSTYEIENTSKIFFEWNGYVVGDHAGCIVYDDDANVFVILVSTWGRWEGDDTIHIVYNDKIGEDILNGVHIVGNMQISDIPEGYDPDLIFYNNNWYASTMSSGGSLYYGSNLSNLTKVINTGGGVAEGPKFQKVGGTWYIFTATNKNGGKVYDIDMNYICDITIPIGTLPNEHPYPHLCIVPISRNDSTYFLIITFNGKDFSGMGNTHGDTLILKSEQIEGGYEFPIKTLF